MSTPLRSTFAPNPRNVPQLPSRLHKDFVLPEGVMRKLRASMALSYSRRFNSRNLECYSYSFWNTVLTYLVEDLEPNATVIPQLVLDQRESASPEFSIVTMSQEDAKEVIPDFSIVIIKMIRHIGYQVQAHSPLAQLDRPEITQPFKNWSDIRIKTLGIPLIAEIKRQPTRSATTLQDFVQSLDTHMRDAQVQLEAQAEYAFAMQSGNGITTLVLLACSGQWWSWRAVTPNDLDKKKPDQVFFEYNNTDDELSDSEDDYEPPSSFNKNNSRVKERGPEEISNPRRNEHREARDRKGKEVQQFPNLTQADFLTDWSNPKTPRGPNKTKQERTLEELKKRKALKTIVQADLYMLYEDQVGPQYLESTREQIDINFSSGTPEWSKYIIFGSDASNENLYFIHRFITNSRDALARSPPSTQEQSTQTQEQPVQPPSPEHENISAQHVNLTNRASGGGTEQNPDGQIQTQVPRVSRHQINAESGPSRHRRR